MEFWYRGRKHLLRGSGSHVLTSSVSKHSGNQSQLCMIQVVPQGSDEMKGHLLENEKQAEENPAILEVLSEFSALFDDPIGLPPSRGLFDHRIVLQSGVEPMNKRPYRYPSVKKDVIEGLVQQILDQGIIQPSCSPLRHQLC